MQLRKMYLGLSLAGTSLFCLNAVSQNSFDEHFSLAKHLRLGQREIEFAKLCNVERASSTVVYERSVDENWTFKRVPWIGRGRDDAEMDYLGNAELWIVEGKPRLIIAWLLIMDTGISSNEMFCLDQSGQVVTQESLNVYEPVSDGAGGWRHLTIRSFRKGEKPRILTDVFLDGASKHVARPNLGKRALSEANAHASSELVNDLIAKYR